MTRLFSIVIIMLSTVIAQSARADESCQWDGLKKDVWVEELDQQGMQMAYPLPHDLITRALTERLTEGNKYLIKSTLDNIKGDVESHRRSAQILIRPKLLNARYNSKFELLGDGPGGMASATLQIALVDNYSGVVIRTLNIGNSSRVWFSLFPFSQMDLNEKTTGMVEGMLPELAKQLDAELDCLPYSARVFKIDNGSVYIAGGLRNNIKPNMEFSILASQDHITNDKTIEGVVFKNMAGMVIESVSPALAAGKTSIAIGENSVVVIATKK